MFKYSAAAIAIALAGGLTASTMFTPQAGAHPTARIKIDITQGGFVFGGTNGQGYVRYHRRNYPVTISGLRFGAIVGFSSGTLTGKVTNLSRLSDIEGTYTSTGATGTLAQGGNWQKLRNEKGVYLNLYGRQTGAEMSLDFGGMTIRIGR